MRSLKFREGSYRESPEMGGTGIGGKSVETGNYPCFPLTLPFSWKKLENPEKTKRRENERKPRGATAKLRIIRKLRTPAF